MLGFTLYWATSRRGYWVVKCKTAKDRLRRAIRRVWVWCRSNRHEPLEAQHQMLARMLRGHYGYFGITGNSRSLGSFYHQVARVWLRWLGRRTNNARRVRERFALLLRRMPLPAPRIVHSVYRRAANP